MNEPNRDSCEILIVDDEPLIRESLYEILRIAGYHVHMAAGGEEALDLIRRERIGIIVTDMKLPRMSGLELLTEVKAASPEIEVILITGYGSIESAVEAMKKGAYDYITKPINDDEIKLAIEKIMQKKRIVAENRSLKEQLARSRPSSFGDMIGSSEPIQRVYHIIESVASSNATILITGESGTGKGLVARAIHQADAKRRDKPFVEVSCGALSETLLESELFGHVKGAFTGAIRDKKGRFEIARGGTLFLDEIDAFTPNLQVKLLRVLQDGIFERVGDHHSRHTDARILVATNCSLTKLVERGEFRQDLYYRINVISIALPPLRDRGRDIDVLIDHFVTMYAAKNKKDVRGVTDELRSVFHKYSWPGNIRELENAIEGGVIMTHSEFIDLGDIPNADRFMVPPASMRRTSPLKKAKENPERELILKALRDCGGNRKRAAEMLGINRTTLYNKMKSYGISGFLQKKDSL